MSWTIDRTTPVALAVCAVPTGLLGIVSKTIGPPLWFWLAYVLWVFLAFVALLMQADTEGRAYLSATLRHRRYTQVYLYLARPLNTWLWHRLGRMEPRPDGTLRPPPETVPLWRLMRMALTWRVLNFALLLAVAYPVLALLRPWLFGGDAVLGAGIVVFPASPFWPDRAIVVWQFVTLTAGFVGRYLAKSSPRRFWRTAADWLPMAASIAGATLVAVLAVAMAGTFAILAGLTGESEGAMTIAGASAVSAAFAFAFAFAFARAMANAGVIGIAFLGAFTFSLVGPFASPAAGGLAGVFVVSVAYFWAKCLPVSIAMLLLIGWSVGLAALAGFADISALPTDQRALIVFLAVLPFINGLFDALSYAATLATMRKGLATRWALLLGLLDLGIGALLFAGLGATMLVVIAALNALANAPLVDLPALFAGLRTSPGDYWWLYMILFSTLVPTALHLLLAALALQGLLPQKPRQRIAHWIGASPHSPLDAVRGFMAQATLWWLPILLLAGGAWALWQGIGGFAARVGLWYLALLETFAIWVGAV